MPRSSRHKSSKHSSGDARDYLDSEKDSAVNDRKGKEDKESTGRVLKDSATSEKRKLDYKDLYGFGNGEYVEDYSSSKRRKEIFEDGVTDRWNGSEDYRGEGTKKSKERSSESKTKQGVESAGVNVEIDGVVKKSSAKSEGKHRELSGRKEGKDVGAERERNRERERDKEREKEKGKQREKERKGKDKDGKSERYADIEDPRVPKHVVENAELSTHSWQSPEPENLSERWRRRKRDGSGDGDKHKDDFVDIDDRQMFSREDVAKDARPRDENHKVERHRDKYHEYVDRETRYHEGKQKDGHVPRDRTNTRSDDKHFKDEKDGTEIRQKKFKPIDLDYDHEQEHDHDNKIDPGHDHRHEKHCNQDHVRERSCNRHCERDHKHSRDQERNHDHDCEQKRYRDCDHDWDQDRDGDRECDRKWNRDRGQEQDHSQDHDRGQYHNGHLDYDGAYIDDQIAKHKDSQGKKISADDSDEHNDSKSRDIKLLDPDMEKKCVSSSKVESDSDRGRSLSCQPLPDSNVSNSRHRTSRCTCSADEYWHIKNEDLKYGDAVTEQRTKPISSGGLTGIAGASDRASQYRSTEKPFSLDDVIMGESSTEICSSFKALPVGLVDRSPLSSSLERRYTNRTDARRSYDIEESGRRNSASKGAARDLPCAEDRSSQDLPADKTPVDESTLAASSVYNRYSQSNSALTPPTGYRGGVGGTFMGALEEDSRMNTGSWYKRTGDPHFARGQGNAWRGAPNWSSPMPNGYSPFRHGPSHGSFQAVIPQFQSPPLFGVRPSMEFKHTGIPYHIPDVDRFPSHLHPVGWQNLMDGSGPSHLHGWDGNNSVYREEMHFYGGEWEQNRHPMNGRGWETSADIWKGNGDGKIDLPSAYLKEAAVVQAPVGDVSTELGGQRPKNESTHEGVQSKAIETKLAVASSAKEYSKSLLNTTNEKTPDTKMSGHDNVAHVFCTYLSKLDISTELVSADFYSQCMSLLNIGKSATADEDTSILVNLKDGGRAVPKNSNTLLSSLPFPAKSNAVCQRAMDIYKKQRWGLGGFHTISGGAANDSLTSNAEEQILDTDMDKVKDPALDCDEEMADVPVLNSDKKKEEAFPIATGQKSHDLLSLYSQEVHVHANSRLVKMEALGEALSHENTEKPAHTVSVDKADWMSSELLSAKEIQKDCALTSDDALQAYTSVSTDGHEKDEIEDVSPVCCDGEGQVLDDAMCGSLLFSDGSSKASETLMPGSNESELVIFSQIHHSPESTR